jgi:hypothetical protein
MNASSMPALLSQQIVIRPLSNLSELSPWSTFCATRGFGQRGPGDPQRFAQRFISDPFSRLEWVLICTAARNSCGIPLDLPAQQLHPLSPPSLPVTFTEIMKDGSESESTTTVLLGSCRLFSRSIYVRQGEGRGFTNAIGWGEVCSEPEMRGKGVAGAVLTKALELSLKAGEGVSTQYIVKHSVALLHAAAGVQGLYQKFGFTAPLRAEYGLWVPPFTPSVNSSDQEQSVLSHCTVRKADFEKDISELQRLHQHTVATLDLIGWTERTAAYWSEWIRLSSRDHMWVLQDIHHIAHDATTSQPSLLAYACAQWQRDGSLKLCDFGFSDSCSKQHAAFFLERALAKGWVETRSRPTTASTAGQRTTQASTTSQPLLPSIVTPLAVLQWLHDDVDKGRLAQSQSVATSVPELADTSWMIRSLNDEGHEVIERLSRGGSRFIAFALDGF